METHDQNQNERNLPSAERTQSQWLESCDGAEPSRNLDYLAEAMELVRRTLSLSNQPNLTEKELGQRAMDWQDALEPEVPLNRLMDAFNTALRSHTGTFPVNAFEVLEAWRILIASQPKINELEFQKMLENQNKSKECSKCLGSGVELAFDVDGKVLGAKAGKACDHQPKSGALFKTAQ